jgi:hypothetical protein
MDGKRGAKQQRGCQPLQEDAEARTCSKRHSIAEPLQEDDVYECSVLIEANGAKHKGTSALLK